MLCHAAPTKVTASCFPMKTAGAPRAQGLGGPPPGSFACPSSRTPSRSAPRTCGPWPWPEYIGWHQHEPTLGIQNFSAKPSSSTWAWQVDFNDTYKFISRNYRKKHDQAWYKTLLTVVLTIANHHQPMMNSSVNCSKTNARRAKRCKQPSWID